MGDQPGPDLTAGAKMPPTPVAAKPMEKKKRKQQHNVLLRSKWRPRARTIFGPSLRACGIFTADKAADWGQPDWGKFAAAAVAARGAVGAEEAAEAESEAEPGEEPETEPGASAGAAALLARSAIQRRSLVMASPSMRPPAFDAVWRFAMSRRAADDGLDVPAGTAGSGLRGASTQGGAGDGDDIF